MTNHPKRNRKKAGSPSPPSPSKIRALRLKAGISQTVAAELIYHPLKSWQNWEEKTSSSRHRPMHPALFELFEIKVTPLIDD